MLKYVALITVNGMTYEYYGNANFEFGLAEEKPTFKLNGNQLVNYPLPHTITLHPMYSTEVELPPPLRFMINGYSILLRNFTSKEENQLFFKEH